MASTILHFGRDVCSRVLVLENAGYRVLDCSMSSRRFQQGLALPHHAIAVSESLELLQSQVLPLLAMRSAPAILFESVDGVLDPTRFDLAVPPLTQPDYWLECVDALLKKSNANCHASRDIQAQSAQLREASVKLREQARDVRDISRKLRGDLGLP